jgi:hypothetical protein
MMERVEQPVIYENPQPWAHCLQGYFPGLS